MSSAEPKSLDRFVEAQNPVYATALGEIRRGAKRSHWMWFIFPQLEELGRSPVAKFYGVRGLDEATAYLAHPVLGSRYVECVEALQDLTINDPVAVFGDVDAMKLRSSLTLFEAAQQGLEAAELGIDIVRPGALLAAALGRWFSDERDKATLALLSN